jgi:hypothetical protein
MANFQKTLEALQPYVIGIRYIDGGVAVVDTIFKEGWTLPESDVVKKAKGSEEMNYYMIFSEKDGIGIDELLEYVSLTIKANIDREKKHELLKEMVNELKLVFKKNTLTNLKRLKFTFGDEEVMPDLNEFDLDEQPTEPVIEKVVDEVITPIEETILSSQEVIKENEGPLSDEDAEILEEERRATEFFKMQKQQKLNGITKKLSSTVELPPKIKNQEVFTETIEPDCDCGPEDACSKCIGTKDF